MSVFSNKEALLHHYVPDLLPHRHEELERLKKWFEPVLSEKVNMKVHIYGPMGTGKTVLCNRLGRYLVDEAERRGVNLKFVYVNMAYTPKPYHVMSVLMEKVTGNPGLGLSPEEMLINVVKKIYEEDLKLVIALDEVDTYIMEKRDPRYYICFRGFTSLIREPLGGSASYTFREASSGWIGLTRLP